MTASSDLLPPRSARRSPAFTARPYRNSLSVQPSYRATSNFPDTHSAALRGASLAFVKPPLKPKPLGNTSTGRDGATAAAYKADSSRNGPTEHWEARPVAVSRNSSPSRHEDNRGSAGPGNGPLYAAQRSVSRERAVRDRSQPRVGPEVVIGGRHARSVSSVSNIAATRAASRASLPLQASGARLDMRRDPSSTRTVMSRDAIERPQERTDSTSIEPTSSLIGMFERRAAAPAARSAAAPVHSPKPVRPVSASIPMSAAMAASQKPPPPQPPRLKRASIALQPVPEAASQPDSSVETSQSVRQASSTPSVRTSRPPAPPPTRKVGSRLAVSASRPRTGSEEVLTSPARSVMPPLPSKPRGPRTRRPKGATAAAARSTSAKSTSPPPLIAQPATPDAHSKPTPSQLPPHPINPSSHFTDAQILTLYAPSTTTPNLPPPPPARRLNAHLTGDSLASAIVASSLASSRAPSPSKSPGPALPRRPTRHRSLFAPLDPPVSRTPSPPKPTALRQTMRTQPPRADDSSDPADKNSAQRGRKHLVRKHPNKHHEGDRKRWRDAVTERERKRYEGVWAANRGCFVATEEGQDWVCSLLVRDLWRRSRLADDVLEEVWDLVDRAQDGSLGREEFVVGMWLLDQRLKGRKLPVRVHTSVWDSVRRMGVRVKAGKVK